jgi:hypothetical protein
MRLPELDREVRVATLYLDLVELGLLSHLLRQREPDSMASNSLLLKVRHLLTLVYAKSEGHPFQEQAQREAGEQREALEVLCR